MEKITRDLKVSGIYCIENKINNKTYIGSSKNLYQRLLKHFALLRHNKHENAHLQSAWNKYGEDSFTFEILDYLTVGTTLSELEKQWISVFESNVPTKGYNNTSGGESCEFNEVARNNMSKAQKEFYKTEKGQIRLKELASYAKGRVPPNKGVRGVVKSPRKGTKLGKQSEELIEKRSKAMLGKNKGSNNGQFGKVAINAKPIYCHQTREIFQSSKEASIKFKIPSKSIRRVASGERSSIYGLTFEFVTKENIQC